MACGGTRLGSGWAQVSATDPKAAPCPAAVMQMSLDSKDRPHEREQCLALPLMLSDEGRYAGARAEMHTLVQRRDTRVQIYTCTDIHRHTYTMCTRDTPCTHMHACTHHACTHTYWPWCSWCPGPPSPDLFLHVAPATLAHIRLCFCLSPAPLPEGKAGPYESHINICRHMDREVY